YMENSQNTAIEVASRLAGINYQMTYQGIYVMDIIKSSDFYGKLAIGDTIYAVDGQKFQSSTELMEAISAKKEGDQITLSYKHGEKDKETTGKLIYLKETKKAGIGITLVDHTELETDEDIVFHTEN